MINKKKYAIIFRQFEYADVAKLADALALGASVLDVGVQVPSSAPNKNIRFDTVKVSNFFSFIGGVKSPTYFKIFVLVVKNVVYL